MYFLFAESNSIMAPFENNVINWIVLVVLLTIMMVKLTPGIFKQREESVQRALDEATRAKEEGRRFFEEQNARIANAEKEAETILEDAKKIAASMQEEIREQTKKETADIARKIEQSIAAERTMAITELRSQAATAAVRLAEAALPGAITASAQKRLMNQFVEDLDSIKTAGPTNGRN